MPKPYDANCLRQAIFSLKKDFDAIDAKLTTDSQTISIDEATVNWEVTPTDFLKRCSKPSEALLDWYKSQPSPTQKPQLAKPKQTTKPPVEVFITEDSGEQILDSGFAYYCAERIGNIIKWNGFLDYHGIKDKNGLSPNQAYTIEVKTHKWRRNYTINISVSLGSLDIWSDILVCDEDQQDSLRPERINAFLSVAVNHIERAIIEQQSSTNTPQESLLTSIEGILSMDKSRLFKGRDAILQLQPQYPDHALDSWLLMANMIAVGEGFSDHPSTHISECEDIIYHAVQSHSPNPQALAMAAHFYMFYQNDFYSAKELLLEASSLAPNNPLVNDAYGLMHLYSDNVDDAQQYIERALNNSRGSVYRHYILISKVMTLAMQGQHQSCISLARKLLEKTPNFDAIDRYAMSSYVNLGQYDDARRIFERLFGAKNQNGEKAIYESPLLSPKYKDDFYKSITTIKENT